MNIEDRLKAVTQIADIGIFASDAMVEGLIADQRVIPYKDALRICKEIAETIFIEDILKLKNNGDSILLTRKNADELSCLAYLESCIEQKPVREEK